MLRTRETAENFLGPSAPAIKVQRHVIAVILCLGLTISYMMRFCISLVITEMTVPMATKEDPNACPFPPEYFTTENEIQNRGRHYSWTEMQQGLILSSFFWGYVLTPIMGGFLSETYGAKPVLGSGITVTSIATVLTPIVIHVWDWKGLIAVRIVVGLSQGLVYASLHTLVAHWIPTEERGRWATVVFAGAQVGNTISMVCTSQLLAKFPKWEIVFYLYGSLGLFWALIFYVTTFSTPVDHPLLTDDEKEILCMYMAKVRKRKLNRGTPWKKIITSRPVLVMIIAMIGHDWAVFTMVTDIPKYMKSVLHFNVKQNGVYLALGYFVITVGGLISGIIADKIEEKKFMSTTMNRKLMATVASVGPSFGLIAVSYSGCNKHVAVSCLIAGMTFMGFYYPSLKVNPIDLAPNFAGTVGALCHSIGGLSGILVPYVVGLLTPNGFLMEWRLVFWLTFVIVIVTNGAYVVAASADLQPWNDDTEEDPLLREEIKEMCASREGSRVFREREIFSSRF